MRRTAVLDPDVVDVIPQRVRDGHGPRVCACQYGACGLWHIGHMPLAVYRGDTSATDYYRKER